MASQREKFSFLASTTIVSYSCGLAEAQSFCNCVFSLAEKAFKKLNIKKKLQGVHCEIFLKSWETTVLDKSTMAAKETVLIMYKCVLLAGDPN